MTHIISIRPPPEAITTFKRARAWTTLQYPDGSGVVLAYRLYPGPGENAQTASLGVAVSGASNKCFHGPKLKRIARARLDDSPVRLEFVELQPTLRGDHVRSAFRALVIERPSWEYVDDQVLRPGRFTQRWGARLLGPDGSLLTAYIDFLHHPRKGPPFRKALSHWILRMPSWVREVV